MARIFAPRRHGSAGGPEATLDPGMTTTTAAGLAGGGDGHRLPRVSHTLMAGAMIGVLCGVIASLPARVVVQLALVTLVPCLVRMSARRWRQQRDEEALDAARHALACLATVYMLAMPRLVVPPLDVLLITYFVVGAVVETAVVVTAAASGVTRLDRGANVVVGAAMASMLVVMDAMSRMDAHLHHLV